MAIIAITTSNSIRVKAWRRPTLRDTEMATSNTAPRHHSNHFGGGFSSTVLFLMGDGHVRGISYSVRPDVLCWTLNATDGRTVTLD